MLILCMIGLVDLIHASTAPVVTVNMHACLNDPGRGRGRGGGGQWMGMWLYTHPSRPKTSPKKGSSISMKKDNVMHLKEPKSSHASKLKVTKGRVLKLTKTAALVT